VPLRPRDERIDLAFISTKAAFHTTTDITVSELLIESLSPADAATGRALRALAG
jgi:D-ribose pyranose/furanose isomerase RbsD